MDERQFIAALREAFPEADLRDDTAVLPAPAGKMLFAADAVVDGVHVDLRTCSYEQAAFKAVTANVSDIYAMGGEPIAVTVTAGLPKGFDLADAAGVAGGLRRAVDRYGLRLAGGDTVATDGPFFLDVAIVGSVGPGRALRRAGAAPGDLVVVTGPLGRSLAGLAVLRAAAGLPPVDGAPAPRLVPAAHERAAFLQAVRSCGPGLTPDEAAKKIDAAGLPAALAPALLCAATHLAPIARPLPAARRPAITAAIDVSDGLARDLRNLCEAGEVGAILDEAALPLDPAAESVIGGAAGVKSDASARENERGNDGVAAGGARPGGDARRRLLLGSGEEYVQLVAISAAEVAAWTSDPAGPARVVGEIRPGEEGLRLRTAAGGLAPMPRLGWEHTF